MQHVAALACDRRGLHAQSHNPADDTAFMADCGIPLRENPALRNDTLRWDTLLRFVVGPSVTDSHNPTAVANLLLQGYRPYTRRSNMTKFRAFSGYCTTNHRAPLPSSVTTIIAYLVYELERGALAPPSLSLSAVESLLSLAGHADPTKHTLVQIALFGYCSGIRSLGSKSGVLVP